MDSAELTVAGDWIKVETTLPDKPEVQAIAGRLGIDPDAVVGKLIRLWSWADQHTTDGNAPGVTSSFVDRCAAVSGFADAMVSVGWLSFDASGMTIPNFAHHNGQTGKSRALTARRVAKHKSKSNADGNDGGVTSALPREEKRRGDISQESHTTPDLRFDRETTEPLAAKLYAASGSAEKNDPFPWQVAVLVSQGAISFNAFHESVESLDTAKGQNKIGYFRRCLERHVGGKQSLKELLKRVKLTKRFPRGPPAESENGFKLDPDSIGSET